MADMPTLGSNTSHRSSCIRNGIGSRSDNMEMEKHKINAVRMITAFSELIIVSRLFLD